MKYIKLFENFASTSGDTTTTTTQQPGWAPQLPNQKPGQRFSIENLPYFNEVQRAINNPDISFEFKQLVEVLRNADSTLIEYLLENPNSPTLLYDEVVNYKSYESLDTESMARQALKHLLAIGAISILVKLFYKLGDYVFSNLDEMGIPAVAGGVLVILLYMAFGKAVGKMLTRKKPIQSQIQSEDENL